MKKMMFRHTYSILGGLLDDDWSATLVSAEDMCLTPEVVMVEFTVADGSGQLGSVVPAVSLPLIALIKVSGWRLASGERVVVGILKKRWAKERHKSEKKKENESID